MPSKKGERKRRPIDWKDERITTVLAMVFEGRKSRPKIAEDCGVPLRTCEDWIAHPDFQNKLSALRDEVLTACDELGYAYSRKEQRVVALSQMAESARVEYEQRPWLQEKRQIGYDTEHDEPLYLINENFNKDAHAAFRESLSDIAKELGHRQTKVEHSGEVDVNERVTFYLPTPETPPDDATH